ncbi:amino acid ABC transporter permease [Defluviimonas sp. WL0002]|uniref:Amino acid ABC transporter permease n=1 Tax=Albidovulum marisflavi TaxID=2984159 RepID=A0ABT2ZDD4_9RHOB|nr:amino acid ABC transporter permease [Defluviimonas sp. WL0002]MCV2869129.1 amino acid ABC transporter permease [Defluviimonas sp. WL0002]
MNRLGKLHWLDWAILALLILFAGYVWFRIDGALNYKWRWEIIPQYLFRYDEEKGRWVANILMQGLMNTVRISVLAGMLALVLGTVLGLARVAQNLAVRMLARTYLEVLRNVPAVVVIFIFYFFLSEQLIAAFGVESWARGIARGENAWIWESFFGDMRRFPSLISGILVLALFESAFVGEIVRAGIQSIPKGQREAAQSIGMTWGDEMRFIVLPQAMRKVVPPLASEFIALVKNSAIVSLISVHDLTYKTVELVSSTRAIFEAWITTAVLYGGLCFLLSLLFRRLERGKG